MRKSKKTVILNADEQFKRDEEIMNTIVDVFPLLSQLTSFAEEVIEFQDSLMKEMSKIQWGTGQMTAKQIKRGFAGIVKRACPNSESPTVQRYLSAKYISQAIK